MQKFRYKAMTKEGESRAGELTADSLEHGVATLRGQGLTVLKIEPVTSRVDGPPSEKIEKPTGGSGRIERAPEKPPVVKSGLALAFSRPALSRKDLTVLTRQLATTLKAGLPLLRILNVLHSECKNPRLKTILEKLGASVQKGARFSEALQAHPDCFDDMYINLVRVGELSGNLPDCIERLAVMLEKEMTLRRKVQSALAYPFFVLIFTSLMTYALVAFLMPMFTPLFEDAKLDIPKDYPLTHVLVQASKFASSKISMMLLVAGLVGAGFLLRAATRLGPTRTALDHAILAMPFLAGLPTKVVAARFARNFSLLLKSGVTVIQAMDLVASAAGNRAVESRLRVVSKSIREGDSISKTLRDSALFPDMLIQMAMMGEEAGSLSEMLERVADYFDEEVDAAVSGLMAVLEPAMMVVIGGVVGVFVMGVLLPILGVSTGYQNQM